MSAENFVSATTGTSASFTTISVWRYEELIAAESSLAAARARTAELEEERDDLRAALKSVAHPLPSDGPDRPPGAWWFPVDGHAVMRARAILGAAGEGG